MSGWSWDAAAAAWPALAAALPVTLAAAAAAYALAIVLGLPWALARAAPARALAMPATALWQLVRSTPLLVQLPLWFFGLPALGVSLSPFAAGAIGLGVHYAAYAAEIWRSGLAAVPAGQHEAARALGLSRTQAFARVVLPQAWPPLVPVFVNLLVALVKETPLLAVVTVIDVLQAARLHGAETFRYGEAMTLAGAVSLGLSLVIAAAGRGVEAALARRRRPA